MRTRIARFARSRPRPRSSCVGVLLALALTPAWSTPATAQTLDEARAHYVAGELSEAIETYRRVAAATEADDPATAGTARNNACVLLTDTGASQAALPECEAALRLRRRSGNARQLARAHNNLGRVLHHLARYEESHRHFDEAITLNRSIDDVAGETVNWANLGVMETQAGWFSRAIESLGRAYDLARRNAGSDWAEQQMRLARINQAVVLERVGAYREALRLYDEVLQGGETILPQRRAALMVNRGVVYRNLGDPIRAIEAFESARVIFEELGDAAALSNVFLNLGLVRQLNMDDPDGAQRSYRRAMVLARESGDRTEEIRILYYLGRLLHDVGLDEESESLFRQCLAASDLSGSSEGRWASLEGLARIARARGDLDGALQGSLRALDAIESVRRDLEDSSLRAGYLGDRRSVYALTVAVLGELEDRDPASPYETQALEIAHRAKARVLLDALGPGVEPGEPLRVATLSSELGDDILLEYFIGETDVFEWVLHGGEVRMRALGSAADVTGQVNGVHRALSRGIEPSVDDLRSLASKLLSGLGPLIDESRHLRIAPDGRLHYLPFEMLEVPGTHRRLIELTTVSYLPNGAALSWLHHERNRPEHVLIGFGDPPLVASAEEPTAAALLIDRFRLGPLPAAAEELEMLRRRIVGASAIRMRGDATEEAFSELVGRGARVVHLVSHTVIDERPERGAAILLAPGPASDGLLYPHEIAGLDYPVDLTVLAACRTALGSGSEGDALATLTGSFLAAGSSAVVATLWDVGDEATRVFMEQFYFQLSRGYDPARAMREAKLRLIANPEWGRDDVWAAYVLVGDTGPIANPGRYGRWMLLLGVLLLFGAGFAILRSRASLR